MFAGILLIFNIIFLCVALYFMIESLREKEARAPYFGLAGAIFHFILIPIIIWVPVFRIPILILFCLYVLALIIFSIPGTKSPMVLEGSIGHVKGEVTRFDERDTVFARTEAKFAHAEELHEAYYKKHPEYKEYDENERKHGIWSRPPGTIDNHYGPYLAMMGPSEQVMYGLGEHAVEEPSPDAGENPLSLENATEMVKKYALHIGADLVGICEVNELWSYTHRGAEYFDMANYGKEIPPPMPYALMFAVEMSYDHVSTAPHTPTMVESFHQYARGIIISNAIAKWFSGMGYNARAQHVVHYDTLMVPLAVDSGLGELGRQGYLIAPKYGCRVRVFGVTTDMPLIPDKPISLGADTFCNKCKKCATSCPSRAIPLEDKVIHNGVKKWKVNDHACYNFWGKVGTDCAICMSICPFSRPDRPIHRLVRWMVGRSSLAQHLFPYIDNLIYGKKWRPKKLVSWLDIQVESKEVY